MTQSALLVFCAVISVIQGRAPLSSDHRIVNGQAAQAGEFPSQLSLQYSGSHYCGASILSSYWALTAAHCVYGSYASSWTLVAGTVNLNSGGYRHQVYSIIIHSGYNENDSWRNDIAVLSVSSPFQLGTYIQPIRLPSQGQNPYDGSTATVIGWGRLQEGGYFPSYLQKVNIAIVNQQTCSNIYYYMGMYIYNTQICAGEGYKGSCNGDSGGPLFVGGTVVGLVSWANGCSRPDYPTVYTRVSAYRNWITQQTGV